MILIGENQYRTLDDDFYVNGKKVLEAYANGIKVYPVTEHRGTLMKFRGKRIFDITREWWLGPENDWENPAHGWEGVERFQTSLVGIASFVAVYEIYGNIDESTSDRYFITDGKSLERESTFPENLYDITVYDLSDGHANVNFAFVGGGEALDPAYNTYKNLTHRIRAAAPDPWSTEPSYQRNRLECSRKMLFKQNISPFKIPPHFQINDFYGGYSLTGINADPYLRGIEEHNNKIYSFSDPYDLVLRSDLNWGNAAIENNSQIVMNIQGHGGGSSGYMHKYCLHLDYSVPDGAKNAAHPYTLTNITKDGVPMPDATAYVSGNYLSFTIPINEIMYIGSKYVAPDWARNVYESDLDF